MSKKILDNLPLPCYPEDLIAEEKRLSESHATLFNKRIWRVDDVARFLGCSVGHIYNLSSDEKIPKIKKGKFLFFIPSEILEWVLQGDSHD